jgi:outer membrane protein assembly factor BamB
MEAQIDWPSFGGDSQRTGWERSDTRITRENVKDFELVLKRKFPGPHAGPLSLTPPVIVGLLISYRGFKELAFAADGSDTIWSVDADLNRVFWKRQFEPKKTKARAFACDQTVATMPTLVPPVIFGKRAAGGHRRPALPGNDFGEVRPVFAVSNDGKLHKLNTSDGSDLSAPLDFLPANVRASALTIHDGTIYASSASGCGGAQSGIWAVDLTVPDPKAVSFTWQGTAYGLGGPAFGNDGTVYLRTSLDTIQSFTPNDLKPKERLTFPENPSGKTPAGYNATTPVVLDSNGRDLIVSSTSDGRLFILDDKSFGRDDHKTQLSQTAPLAAAGGIWGGLAGWKDPDGKLWVFAPVWGKLNPDLKPARTNGPVTNGAIVAFKVEEQHGMPVLTPAWVSRDMRSPVPPVTTSGAVFALSAGAYSSDGQPKGPSHATLIGLDAQTGEEIYSTGNAVTAPGALTGLTVSNGRVYFATADGTLYAFGIRLEI